MLTKVPKYLYKSYWKIGKIIFQLCPKLMPDKYYLSVLYYKWLGKKINWKNPQTFTEKLQWLKLYNRNPLYTTLVDKYKVKGWVSDKIGEKYVVPTLGVWNHYNEIDFDELPNQFVLKCTHDSGSVIICKDKATFDKNAAKEKLEKALSQNFYWWAREWPYKRVKHRIIAEKFINRNNGSMIIDYKFWCFGGKPVYMYCTVKDDHIFENYYNMNFEAVNIPHGFPRHFPEFEKPSNFEQMKTFAARLSQGIPFVRIDFYCIENQLYFGEYTFFDWGGFLDFSEKQQDFELGQLIKIDNRI